MNKCALTCFCTRIVSALNPTPPTISPSPKLRTLNPQPSTINPKPEIPTTPTPETLKLSHCRSLDQSSGNERVGRHVRRQQTYICWTCVCMCVCERERESLCLCLCLCSCILIYMRIHTRSCTSLARKVWQSDAPCCISNNTYRGTPLIRKHRLLGPMPRALWESQGGWRFLVSEVPLYPTNDWRITAAPPPPPFSLLGWALRAVTYRLRTSPPPPSPQA